MVQFIVDLIKKRKKKTLNGTILLAQNSMQNTTFYAIGRWGEISKGAIMIGSLSSFLHVGVEENETQARPPFCVVGNAFLQEQLKMEEKTCRVFLV